MRHFSDSHWQSAVVRLRRGFVAGLALLCLPWIVSAAPEVALLVDVSGSMKANDPSNLRKPAVELLTRLLPEGTRLESWRFAETVEPLGESLIISDKTRAAAEQQSSAIDSHGRLTDMEAAMSRAISSWHGKAAKAERHLIILTDGFVDLGPDPEKNAASRQAILQKLLPVAVEAQVHIHAVGLSGAADRELLRRLSLKSGGRYVEADGAEALQKAFLAIFDTAVPAERIPIEGKAFRVDDKVREFTLLAFRPKAGETTRLFSPSGTEVSAANLPANARWDHSPQYDLVTVRKPEAGEWRLQAELGPDSRVTVISDLSLVVDGMPVNTAAGLKHDLDIHLLGDGKIIRQKDFLMMTTVQVQQGVPGELPVVNELYNGPRQGSVMAPDDGVFHASVGSDFKPGSYIVRVRVDSKTFSRTREQLVTVAGNAGELPEPVAVKENHAPAKKAPKEKHDGIPLWWWIVGGVVATALVGAGGFFGYVAFRKWQARKKAEAGTHEGEDGDAGEEGHSSRKDAGKDDHSHEDHEHADKEKSAEPAHEPEAHDSPEVVPEPVPDPAEEPVAEADEPAVDGADAGAGPDSPTDDKAS